MKNTLLYSAAALIATSAAANAQSIDYQVMGDMFGEPVTTGATGAPQRSTEVPATMIIITQDDIASAPEYDIPGILRHYSGVDVARFSMGQGEVGIRSAATPYTPRLLVLVNGDPLGLMREHGRRFYFDQDSVLVDRFGIRNVPAVIQRADPVMQVEEIVVGSQ